MGKWKSSAVLFLSIFLLYAIYLWFVKESHELIPVLLESIIFSGVLTVLSTGLDVVKGRFLKK